MLDIILTICVRWLPLGKGKWLVAVRWEVQVPFLESVDRGKSKRGLSLLAAWG